MTIDGTPTLSGRLMTPLAAAAVALMMTAPAAIASTVTVSGTDYNIESLGFNRSFEDDETALMNTPWWGNPALANDLANAYLAQVGTDSPEFIEDPASSSILYFVYEKDSFFNGFETTEVANTWAVVKLSSSSIVQSRSPGQTYSDPVRSYAFEAEPVMAPVPLPPAGLALGAALMGLAGLRRWKGARAS